MKHKKNWSSDHPCDDFEFPLQAKAVSLHGERTAISEDRTIWLFNDVDEYSALDVIQQIVAINVEDDRKEKEYALDNQQYIRHPIKLMLSSYGGNVLEGFGIIGAMLNSKTPIHSYAFGKVMSMGVYISVAASKRFSTRFTTFMIHSLQLSEISGSYRDITDHVADAARLQTQGNKLLLSRTKIEESKLKTVVSNSETWIFDEEEALQLGVIDAIV